MSKKKVDSQVNIETELQIKVTFGDMITELVREVEGKSMKPAKLTIEKEN